MSHSLPPIMDGKRHPKKSSTTTTSSAVSAAVYNHFSRFHPKPQTPPPQKVVDTHLQTKALSKSINFEPSAHKVVGKQGKRVVLETDKKCKNDVIKQEYQQQLPKCIPLSQSLGSSRRNSVTLVEAGSKEIIKPTRITIEKVGLNGKIGRRRSFCDAQVELANFLVTNSAKMVSADMPPFMQIHAVGFARKIKDSLEKFTSKSLALSLKKEFDGSYGPAWHCIVGTSFGSFVTHSVGGFLYFSMDQKVFVLLFKTTVQRAD